MRWLAVAWLFFILIVLPTWLIGRDWLLFLCSLLVVGSAGALTIVAFLVAVGEMLPGDPVIDQAPDR
jgi:hypothetical protein